MNQLAYASKRLRGECVYHGCTAKATVGIYCEKHHTYRGNNRGKSVVPAYERRISNWSLSWASPQMIVRVLRSCGYLVKGTVERHAPEWLVAEVVDAKTEEPRGRRWVRKRAAPGTGFEIRKEPP